MKDLLNQKEVGVIVIDNSDLLQLPERLRIQLSESITPTVLGIGTEEDNTLRESIKSALGVDLWK
jgi:V/A-type H+-transporting ATPase subunit F